MKKINILLLTALLLGACSVPAADDLKLKETAYTYELGSEISFDPKDYLEETAEDILSETALDVYVVTDGKTAEAPLENTENLSVGEYVFRLTYKDETEEVNIKIQDTTAPQFVKFSSEVTFQVGDVVDLTQIFNAEDQSKVKITIEGIVNFNEVGEYPVIFIASDEYGNKTEKECLIKIVERADAGIPTPQPIPVTE